MRTQDKAFVLSSFLALKLEIIRKKVGILHIPSWVTSGCIQGIETEKLCFKFGSFNNSETNLTKDSYNAIAYLSEGMFRALLSICNRKRWIDSRT